MTSRSWVNAKPARLAGTAIPAQTFIIGTIGAIVLKIAESQFEVVQKTDPRNSIRPRTTAIAFEV